MLQKIVRMIWVGLKKESEGWEKAILCCKQYFGNNNPSPNEMWSIY